MSRGPLLLGGAKSLAHAGQGSAKVLPWPIEAAAGLLERRCNGDPPIATPGASKSLALAATYEPC